MKTRKLILGAITALFIGTSFAGHETPYYEKLPIGHGKNGVVEITYFSNPNCPSCNKFSPIFDQWKEQNSGLIKVKESVYAPFKKWLWASKSYVVAKEIDPSISRAKFSEFKQKSGVGDVTDILRAADVVSIATKARRGNIMTRLSMLETDKKVKALQSLGELYGVTGVPSLVISTEDNSYRVSPEFRLSYESMLKISNALIAINLPPNEQLNDDTETK